MYSNKKISCVVPCYNEEAGLEKILQNKPVFIDEVIVVDNGSTDRTAVVADKYGAVVIHERKRGYGYAYQAGLSAAGGDIIVALDGDCSYPVSEIEKMLSYMQVNNLDFVVGCRYPLADKDVQPVINTAANYAISCLVRFLFRIKLVDSQSGMMVFKSGILKKIEGKSTGMGFSLEVKVRAFLDQSIKCGEVHIPYLSRVGISKFRKMKDSIQNFSLAMSLWVKLIFMQKNEV